MNQMIMHGGGRNHAVDIMKFLAAIAITNSHMINLYPEKYNLLATGGAIGDALFFFCSGFLLVNSRGGDFFNWYKRRINRIFPTIFAVALVGIIFDGNDPTLKHVIVNSGGWFVQAIFLFYALFWFVRRFLTDKLWIAILTDLIITLLWFIWFWDKSVFILYDGTYLRWAAYFGVMLTGAMMSNYIQSHSYEGKKHSGLLDVTLLIVLLIFYYGYQLAWNQFPFLKDFQIILVLSLIGIVVTIYRLCSSHKVISVYLNKYLHWFVYGVSACCLEIYLCGGMVFWIGRKLIGFFPLNIIVTFLCIFIVAYFVKVFSSFLGQTFKSENYDWKAIVKL